MGEKDILKDKTSQELRMLSRSLSDCKSLLLTVMIQVSQCLSVIVSCVTKSLIHKIAPNLNVNRCPCSDCSDCSDCRL